MFLNLPWTPRSFVENTGLHYYPSRVRETRWLFCINSHLFRYIKLFWILWNDLLFSSLLCSWKQYQLQCILQSAVMVLWKKKKTRKKLFIFFWRCIPGYINTFGLGLAYWITHHNFIYLGRHSRRKWNLPGWRPTGQTLVVQFAALMKV